MSTKEFKVSDEAIEFAISEITKKRTNKTPESIYQDGVIALLEEHLSTRPFGGSEIDPDGSQILKVCGGL